MASNQENISLVLQRYQAMLARGGTPLERFARLMTFHMSEGTRPPNSARRGDQWTPKELADELGMSEKSVANLQKGKQVPPYANSIESAFLGPKTNTETAEHALWRQHLRDYHREARDLNLHRVRHRSHRAAGRETERIEAREVGRPRRDPILRWHMADTDKRRNECLDEEMEPVDFFVSVGAFKNAGSQITLRMKSHVGASVKIKTITLLRLHPTLVHRLVVAELLDPEFDSMLETRISDFATDVGRDPRDIPIFVRLWRTMPMFHGYVFAKRRFTNQWGFDGGKLHVDIPLLEYPSPDWDKETEGIIEEMSRCELAAKYFRGRKIEP